MPELVTHSLADYRALAAALATDPERLADVRAKLAAQRRTQPLFDTPSFVRHLEAAYSEVWRLHVTGQEPKSFDVAA